MIRNSNLRPQDHFCSVTSAKFGNPANKRTSIKYLCLTFHLTRTQDQTLFNLIIGMISILAEYKNKSVRFLLRIILLLFFFQNCGQFYKRFLRLRLIFIKIFLWALIELTPGLKSWVFDTIWRGSLHAKLLNNWDRPKKSVKNNIFRLKYIFSTMSK